MTMQDPIADMLTRVRNGQAAAKKNVTMPGSKAKLDVARVLKDEGYIADYAASTVDGKPSLTIELKYHEGKPVIESIKRVSRPGLRMYRAKDKVPRIMGGMGIVILSTSRGVMSDRAARAQHIGGEVICAVS